MNLFERWKYLSLVEAIWFGMMALKIKYMVQWMFLGGPFLGKEAFKEQKVKEGSS